MGNIIERVNVGGTTYNIASTAYAVCSNTAAEAKSINIDGFSLVTGVTIHVKFENNNTVASPTLTISGGDSAANTAIPIVGIGAWDAGAVITLTYDGTNWVRDYDVVVANNLTGSGTSGSLAKFNGTNSITDGPALTTSYNSSTAVTTAHKFLREDGTWVVPKYTTNTDEKVKLTGITSNGAYPILLKNTTGTSDVTAAAVNFGKTTDKVITANPSTGAITAPGGFVGNASTATKFSSTRTISLSGDITGSATANGESGWSITNTAIGAGKVTNTMLEHDGITIGSVTKKLGETFLLSDLGIAAAMNFKGTTTTQMTDGRTTATITINGESYTPVNGDVVIYGDSEFVWTGSAWERLGRDSSWALDTAVIHNTLTHAKGDIIYASSADTPAALNIGTEGQVLKVGSSGVPVWGTDNDTKVSQTLDSTSTTLLPLLFSLSATSTTTATVTNTVKRNNSIYVLPSTGTLYATKFHGDGSDLSNVTASSVAWSNVTGKISNRIYVNATAAGATSDAATENATTYMHLYDNNSKVDTIQFTGSGGTTITATASKVITIKSNKYKSSGSANAFTSLKLKYNDGTAHDDAASSASGTPTALGSVTNAVLYIKSIYYGTTSVSTGVSVDNS